ncbi:ankyrin repeat domain-containing protein [Psychromonas arctica]|uniref:Ankyrin repeat domain-containing protein n=1 Tax=Psychromonas arctica TaxID=168275 RepID=A0ABU9HAZ6_9GAMM
MPQIVYFSMQDDIEAVKKLIEAGADVNKLSSSNESALLMAVQDMQVNLTPLNSMLSTKFDLIAALPHNEKSVNAVTLKKKLTPLGCAVQTGRLDIVKKVVELGAKIDQRHDVGDETSLFTCIRVC